MTTINLYQNKRNIHKFLEVHEDGYGHRTVRQFIDFHLHGTVNLTGDGMLHRWRKAYLDEVLEDYNYYGIGGICFKKWFADSTRSQRSHYLKAIRRNK